MAGGIFINYRRDDSHGTAGRLRDRLARDPRSSDVFMDVDNIPAGVDFIEYLNDQVAGCDVLIAVIGPNWLHAKDEAGQPRLANPGDYVRVEIAAALSRKIRVVPVLVDGARIPRADDLPDDLKPLVRRNAIELRNAQFGRDADALADNLLDARKPRRAGRSQWVALTAGVAALLLVVAAGWAVLHRFGVAVPWPWPPSLAELASNELSLVNSKSGKCLTGPPTFDNNVLATLSDCNRDPHQHWWVEQESNGSGIYKVKNVKTARCLTISGGTSTENYVPALQFACDEDPSRTWRISAVSGTLYRIENAHTRRCLTASDRDNTQFDVRAGAPVQYECDNDPASLWTLRPKP